MLIQMDNSMIKKIKLIISILIICTISGCNQNKLNYTKLSSNSKIMAFGDSLTFGYGGEDQSYPKELADISIHEVVNYGVNGDTTAKGLDRIEEALEKEQPGLVILSLGGNDMLQQVPITVIQKNLKKMIHIIKSKNIQVVLLAEPQPRAIDLILGKSIINLKDASLYQEIAEGEKILNISQVYSDLLSDPKNKSDLIHLNGKGYKQVGQKVYQYLHEEKIL
jgi:acyl-CoA thioesterase-1